MDQTSFIVNGREVKFSKGQTILEAAADNGVKIPTLCFLKGASPKGHCGVCVVEESASGDILPACSTLAAKGMIIKTMSQAAVAKRKEAIEKLLASGLHNCAAFQPKADAFAAFQLAAQESDGTADLCPAWGDCRLQDLAFEYQVQPRQTPLTEEGFARQSEEPLILRDFARCIGCGRCAAACNEIQGHGAIKNWRPEPLEADSRSRIYPIADAECVFCGECVQACPVGALIEKKSAYRWRPWDVEKIRTTCPYCGVGCQQILHVRDGKIVRVTGAQDAQPNQGRLCVKGRYGYDFIYSEERLKMPLIREGEHFREVSWDEALDYTANRLKEIIRESGPDALAGVSCARSINEDSYQMQKFFRAVLGTNNIDHCART